MLSSLSLCILVDSNISVCFLNQCLQSSSNIVACCLVISTEEAFDSTQIISLICTGFLPSLICVPSINCQSMRTEYPTNDDLRQVLEDVGLGYLLLRFNSLDSINEWSNVLSLGEQQRLAFGRLLLSKPYLALLDEATSALDEVNEVLLPTLNCIFVCVMVIPFLTCHIDPKTACFWIH